MSCTDREVPICEVMDERVVKRSAACRPMKGDDLCNQAGRSTEHVSAADTVMAGREVAYRDVRCDHHADEHAQRWDAQGECTDKDAVLIVQCIDPPPSLVLAVVVVDLTRAVVVLTLAIVVHDGVSVTVVAHPPRVRFQTSPRHSLVAPPPHHCSASTHWPAQPSTSAYNASTCWSSKWASTWRMLSTIDTRSRSVDGE